MTGRVARARRARRLALLVVELFGNSALWFLCAVALVGGQRDARPAVHAREVVLLMSSTLAPEVLLASWKEVIDLARDGSDLREEVEQLQANLADERAENARLRGVVDELRGQLSGRSAAVPVRIVADEGAEHLVPPLVAAAKEVLGAVEAPAAKPKRTRKAKAAPPPVDDKAVDDGSYVAVPMTVEQAFGEPGPRPTCATCGAPAKVADERSSSAWCFEHAPRPPGAAGAILDALAGTTAPAPTCIRCGAPATHFESWGGQNQTFKCAAHASKDPGEYPAVNELAGTPDRAPDPPEADPDPAGLFANPEGAPIVCARCGVEAALIGAGKRQYLCDCENHGVDYKEVEEDEVGRLRAHFEVAAKGLPDEMPSKKGGTKTRDQVRAELSEWAAFDLKKLRAAVDRIWELRGDYEKEIEKLAELLPPNWRGTIDMMKKARTPQTPQDKAKGPPMLAAHHTMLRLHETIALADFKRAAEDAAAKGAPPEAFARLLEGADGDERLSGWGRAAAARTIEAASYDAAKRRKRGPDPEREAIAFEGSVAS